MMKSVYSMLVRALCLRFWIDDPGGGGGGGGTVSPPAPAPAAETFSKEYVSELRKESAGYRLKYQESERKAQEAEERAKKAEEAAEAKVKEASTAAQQRILRAELKTAALKAGMVDLDGLKLADLSKVTLNEDTGEVEGAEALMEELKKAKPYLFQGAPSTSSTSTPPPAKPDEQKDARKLSDADYLAEKKRLGLA
ncbi:hypothetical protein J5T34_05925 [Cupriavidus gilardii]|uniref:phage scaffolding protein n=1 Tax=Cupriavidus gilardii TaxID=82541 RepID=UPI001ABDE309|nr:hypothetical protein [Cupriavidus gilardii]MBO4120277.1 hypothetical protein [Cupriavidus gilardii]